MNIVNRRIEEIIKAMDLSPSQFADAVGVQRATVSHILSDRNNPSLDFVQKLLTRYPALNPDWILSGKGEMWRQNEPKDNLIQPTTSKTNAQEHVQQTSLFDVNRKSDDSIVSNTAARIGNDIKNQRISKSDLKIQPENSELSELAHSKMQKKKVEKVIILYDDSTFEIFTEY